MRQKKIILFAYKINPPYEDFYKKAPIDLQARLTPPKRLDNFEIKLRINLLLNK